MSKPNPKIAVLVSARKNSKYLAKFLLGVCAKTSNAGNVTVDVMLNAHDTWNDELVQFFERLMKRKIRFHEEDRGLGRGGLHEYFNTLVEVADPADWYIYFCEDHFITMSNWDGYVLSYISGERTSGDSKDLKFPLDPSKVWVLVPKFDNCGAMNHIVSRGFIEAMGGKIGNHGWIDSYLNTLMSHHKDRLIRMDDEMLHDFTHDMPDPLDPINTQTAISEEGKRLPKLEDPVVQEQILADVKAINDAIERGK